MLLGLAFLPVGDVIGFEELVDTVRVIYDDMADNLLEYFKDTHICRYHRNVPRHPPFFVINLSFMFNRIDDELSHTNKSVEGWHQSLQGRVLACHPAF